MLFISFNFSVISKLYICIWFVREVDGFKCFMLINNDLIVEVKIHIQANQ